MPRAHYLAITILALALVGAYCFWSQRTAYPTLTLGDTEIKLELAQTDEEQELGLSYRESLPAETGMLFVYTQDTRPSFWMKGMNFPLDIIWLDQNWQIVGYERNVSPDTYPQTFPAPAPIRYVLEVNAGFVDKHSLKVGDKAYN